MTLYDRCRTRAVLFCELSGFPRVFLEHVWVGMYTEGLKHAPCCFCCLPPAIAFAGVHLCTDYFLAESLTPRRCTFWKEMIWSRAWKALLVVRPCFLSNLAMGSCMRNTSGWIWMDALCIIVQDVVRLNNPKKIPARSVRVKLAMYKMYDTL